jgi:fructoselysine-6-P-deglycase FrlB-like protein
VILFAPTGFSSDSILATVTKIRAITNNIFWIGQGFTTEPNEIKIGGSSGLSEIESTIADVIVLQQFAMLLAIKNGLNPDAPTGLLKVTQTL